MKIKIMAICLVCALLLSACGSPATPTDPSATATTQSTETTTEPTEVTTEPTEATTEPIEVTTEPTEAATQPTEAATESTRPSTEPSEDATEPSEEPTETTEPTQSGNSGSVTYEEYMAMSPAGQQAFFESFGSYQDFIAWYMAAEAAYKENQDRNEVGGDGNIDIGDIIGGGNG